MILTSGTTASVGEEGRMVAGSLELGVSGRWCCWAGPLARGKEEGAARLSWRWPIAGEEWAAMRDREEGEERNEPMFHFPFKIPFQCLENKPSIFEWF